MPYIEHLELLYSYRGWGGGGNVNTIGELIWK